MAEKRPAWRETLQRAELHWVSPLDFSAFEQGRFGPERNAFLQSQWGVYLWRVKAWGGFVRRNLYVGQTWDGFAKRTRSHLDGDLGTKLRALRADGKEPYFFCAAVTPAEVPKGRGSSEWPKAFLDSIERALIWELKPEFNTHHTVTMELPLSVSLTHAGEVPAGLGAIEMRQGKHHRS